MMKSGYIIRRFLFVTIVAFPIVSLIISGCTGQAEVTSEETAGEATTEEPAGKATPSEEVAGEGEPSRVMVKIGEEASNGQVAVTVHSVEFYDQITGGLGGVYKPREESDVFVIVDLTVRNMGGSILKVSPAYVKLYDNQSNSYTRTTLIIMGKPYDLNNLTSEEVSTGEERRGMVVFSAKEGAILDEIVYTTPKPSIEFNLQSLTVAVPHYSIPRIGEVAGGGGIEIRVDSVRTIEELREEYGEDSEYFNLTWTETAKEGYQLLVVDLSIKNVLIEPKLTVNPLYVLLIDTESKAYDKVMVTLALEEQLRLTDLSPGEETFGRLLFHIPVGVQIDRLMYKIGTLGHPVEVSLR